MRVLLIGGTGFIGAPTARALLDLGHDVAVFHRGQTDGALPAEVTHISGDRSRFHASALELRGFAPESIVDMTPMNEANAQGALTMATGLGRPARRFVAVSSMDVYQVYGRLNRAEPGEPDPAPLSEDSPLREVLFPYRGRPGGRDDYEKILVERAVMGAPAVDGIVIRLPIVYGPRDRQHRILDDLRRMDDGRPAILIPQALAAWRIARAYVDDCARAIALAATHPAAAGRIYHVAEPEALSQAQWTRAVGEAAGWTGQVLAVPDADLPKAWRAPVDARHHLVADSSRIRHELGYTERVGRDEGLRRTVAYERENPVPGLPPIDYAAEDAVLSRLRAR